MEADKINRWLTLGANLGVLAGLLLVAVEINQNTALTRALLENDYYLADMQLELAMMGDDPMESWVKAVYAPDELTRKDAGVVDRYFSYGMIQLNRLKKMHELGLANEGWKERYDWLVWHLGNEAGRRWWAFYREVYPDDAHRELIDTALEDTSFSANHKMLEAMNPN